MIQSHKMPTTITVKVFASWCKTCQKFDLRYRKLANQHSDSFDAKSKTTKPGRVRFAEMQYDNPNNEEMCQLLNATKLPYIIMYKGSRGKVDEFQCGPGTFQVLIDKVNEYADSEDIAAAIPMFVNGDEIAKTNDMSEAGQQINPTKEVQFSATDKLPVSQNEEKLAQSKPMIPVTDVEPIIQPTSDVESLKEQLVIANNEKIELFEVMKADLDWHKEQIKQLNDAIQSQRDQYEGLLRVRDGDLTRLEQILSEQKTQFEIKLTGLEDDVDKVSSALQQSQETIDTLESEVALWQQRAYEVAQSEDETNRLEQKVTMYENERNSLRKLSVLVVQRVWRAAGSLISRLKKI